MIFKQICAMQYFIGFKVLRNKCIDQEKQTMFQKLELVLKLVKGQTRLEPSNKLVTLIIYEGFGLCDFLRAHQ